MRARNLKPGFFKNEILSSLPPQTRLLFAGLWLLADRKGRLEDRPLRIKAELFPYDDWNIDTMLTELDQAVFIKRYSITNEKYIQILNFEKHQTPHWQEKDSIIPDPNVIQDKSKRKSKPIQDNSTSNPSSSLNPSSLTPDTDGRGDFNLFWNLYPKKKSKGQAEKAWFKLNPTKDLIQIILEKVEEAKGSKEWQGDNGRYIPHPATWLNAKGWEDEISTQSIDDPYKNLEYARGEVKE